MRNPRHSTRRVSGRCPGFRDSAPRRAGDLTRPCDHCALGTRHRTVRVRRTCSSGPHRRVDPGLRSSLQPTELGHRQKESRPSRRSAPDAATPARRQDLRSAARLRVATHQLPSRGVLGAYRSERDMLFRVPRRSQGCGSNVAICPDDLSVTEVAAVELPAVHSHLADRAIHRIPDLGGPMGVEALPRPSVVAEGDHLIVTTQHRDFSRVRTFHDGSTIEEGPSLPCDRNLYPITVGEGWRGRRRRF